MANPSAPIGGTTLIDVELVVRESTAVGPVMKDNGQK